MLFDCSAVCSNTVLDAVVTVTGFDKFTGDVDDIDISTTGCCSVTGSDLGLDTAKVIEKVILYESENRIFK